MIAYMRFGRRCFNTATECGAWNCDILGTNGKSTTEIEIKCSLSDLKNELKSKTKIRKHQYYKNGIVRGKYYLIPNYYFICVPEKIGNKSLKIVNQLDDRYGLIIFNGWDKTYYKGDVSYLPNQTFEIIKKAKKIVKNYDKRFEIPIQMRMSTELYSIYEKYILELKNNRIL